MAALKRFAKPLAGVPKGHHTLRKFGSGSQNNNNKKALVLSLVVMVHQHAQASSYNANCQPSFKSENSSVSIHE